VVVVPLAPGRVVVGTVVVVVVDGGHNVSFSARISTLRLPGLR
jgi:hypothetical protein